MKKILYSVFAIAMAAFTFTSCEDVPAPYDDPNDNPIDKPAVIEPAGDGTKDNPFNVAATIAEAEKLASGEESVENFYMKGIVTNITENYDGGYGNATFYISDDEDGSNSFYIYRTYYFGNKKYDGSGDIIEYGDTVVVYGKLTNYNGTLETAQNSSYLISINGVEGGQGGDTPTPGDPQGDGTLANPYNCAAAIAYVSSLPADEDSENDVYIKGIVSSIKENFDETGTFGNATYYISDDGSQNNEFYIYRSLYLDNKAYTSGEVLHVGDEVIVCGKVTNFMGNTPETVTNQSYLYSLNSKGGQGGDDDQPGTSGEGLATVTKSGTTITMVDPDITTTGSTVTCDLSQYTSSQPTEATTVTMSDGTTITFAQEDGRNAPMFYELTKGVRMYALNSMTIAAGKKIAKVVLQCDSQGSNLYVGNDQLYTAIDGNTWKLVNDWSSNSGGTQLRIQTITITYAE